MNVLHRDLLVSARIFDHPPPSLAKVSYTPRSFNVSQATISRLQASA
jgi:hypothetical protein